MFHQFHRICKVKQKHVTCTIDSQWNKHIKLIICIKTKKMLSSYNIRRADTSYMLIWCSFPWGNNDKKNHRYKYQRWGSSHFPLSFSITSIDATPITIPQLLSLSLLTSAMKRGQHDVACACYVCHMKLWNCVLHSIRFSDLNKMHRLSIFCFLSENITEFRCWCQTQVFIHWNQEREACCRMKVTVRVMYFDRTQYPLSTRENGRRASELINIILIGKTAHKPSAPVFFPLHTRIRKSNCVLS